MDRRLASKLHRLYLASQRRVRPLWIWARGTGRHAATVLTRSVLDRAARNLARRRLLSFPHALVLVWVVVLMWGERWVFDRTVDDCAWRKWEKWPKGALPHHLILVADPQIIDPHSYPGRPWPLSALTVLITDNYMRRGFAALQRQLHPDSLFFLGDLFDGGREWKTRMGGFVDPHWGTERSGQEKKWVKTWHRKYGDDFWLREYQRFNAIFTDAWNVGGDAPGPWQRGRKLVASLPGNHDLGFGAQVQLPVRDRFSAFFGDVNRVDVIGNHTIVSVDTVSLSAETSPYKDRHDLRPIYGPVNEFLDHVQSTKRRAAREELSVWHDERPRPRLSRQVEDLSRAHVGGRPKSGDADGPDLPTILLTHVPLYREPGTPCGPRREHRPPTRPPKGQKGPVSPDHGNAISVTAGYQYQNVLNPEDSDKLIKTVGNVTHVFSGDDHDYCELVHPPSRGGVREITVKSFSMAMGVSTPGFVMVSLYNPVGVDGKPMAASADKTLQTHLCLLPNQMGTYIRYAAFVMLTVVALAARAFLVPILGLEPFALEPEKAPQATMLPVYQEKAKTEPPIVQARHAASRPAAATSGARNGSAATDRGPRWSSKKSGQGGRWGWAGDEGGPRIKLDSDFYDGGKEWRPGTGRRVLGTFGREMWTTTWRVAWMTVVFWAHLARKG